MATNLNTEVNNYQMARIYDDIMAAHEAGLPYQDVISAGAISAAVATQYGHRWNLWNPWDEECWCNEDFAREYHQLFFGILGVEDPEGIDNHETVTIKNTAKALTHMVVEYDEIIRRLPEWVFYLGHPYHYPGHLTLDILNNEIPGTNAKERIEYLSQIAINHPESLKNLPVKIISGLADDDLDPAENPGRSECVAEHGDQEPAGIHPGLRRVDAVSQPDPVSLVDQLRTTPDHRQQDYPEQHRGPGIPL